MPQQEENVVGSKQIIGIMAWMLYSVHGVARTIQIFTRKPGSCGRSFFGVTLWIGFGVMLLVLPMFLPPEMPNNLAVFTGIIYFGGFMQLVHFLATQGARSKGALIHSYEPGIPILKTKPGADIGTANTTIDVVFSILLGMLCFLLGTPALSIWYCLCVPVAVAASRSQISYRDNLRTQRIDDAAIEGQYMSDRLRGRYDNLGD